MFVTAELRGSIEPCGCTSDPLGDLARTAQLIKAARRGKDAVLYIDAGSMLYSGVELEPHLEAQEALKASLLVNAFGTDLEAAAVGLGPYDLAKGPENVRPPRQVANLPATSKVPTAPPRIVEVGGVEVGIFGVVEPSAVPALAAEPVVPAARAAVASLEKQGAKVIVALAHMDRRGAVEFAREVAGIDFVVVGQNAPEPDEVQSTAQKIGDSWLLQPANRGQVVTRVDVTVRPGEAPLVDAGGKAAATARLTDLDDRIAKLTGDLAKWKDDASADQAFVAQKAAELEALRAERTELATTPLSVPSSGSWFTLEQLAIRRSLPCDEAVQAAKVAYDQAAGKANVLAATGTKPPPVAAGQAGFVGPEECSYCHDAAVKFWQRTRHAQAWETLERIGKQYNFECISCHVTGWEEPGGSNLAVNEHLRDVQCEVCHGPGSLHVDNDGKGGGLTLAPPETRCVTCHNEMHSDTFQYEAYLRDVTGPGHGQAFRERLGDGPTGHQLRSAALQKAGMAIGKGCAK